MHVLTNDSGVLLTGCTGLIGGEILRELLHSHDGELWALVRRQGRLAVTGRVVNRLQRSASKPLTIPDNLKPTAGDVCLPKLGLSANAYSTLTQRVQIIIHCAACTSFVNGEQCWESNVRGVENLIRFAQDCINCPLVVYVGAACCVGAVHHRCIRENEIDGRFQKHYNEYTRSKAFAEWALWDSGLPLLILRPSVVFGNSISDRAFARSILWAVPLLMRLRNLPLAGKNRLDIIPVSFVVSSLLSLLRKRRRTYRCYHLSAGCNCAVTARQFMDYVEQHYNMKGTVRFSEDRQRCFSPLVKFNSSDRSHRLLRRLSPYLPFLNMDVVFDNRRLTDELGNSIVKIPPLNTYLGELLGQITWREAVRESANP